MTHEVVERSTTTELYFKENYLQKIKKTRKQINKWNDGKTSNDGDASTIITYELKNI